MVYIRPKLVALYLVLEGFVHNCVLNNMYWFNNKAGMNHLKINNKSVHLNTNLLWCISELKSSWAISLVRRVKDNAPETLFPLLWSSVVVKEREQFMYLFD